MVTRSIEEIANINNTVDKIKNFLNTQKNRKNSNDQCKQMDSKLYTIESFNEAEMSLEHYC